jgi:hypothetical protein
MQDGVRSMKFLIVITLTLLLSGCAGFSFERLPPVSETERVVLDCDQIALEIEKAEHFIREVGDLVYLPRGVVHRGFGGVVAQVITVPGFIPGSEIGVDHHLRAINERLDLNVDEALPFNLEASDEEVIR